MILCRETIRQSWDKKRGPRRFTCPITLRECEVEELIGGHILNEKLAKANRRTGIQYGKVDNFYGTTVEPGFIRYWNQKDKSFLDQIKENKDVRVCFADGSRAEAFLANSRSARKASGKFPNIILRRDGVEDIELFVRTTKDDPRLNGGVDLETSGEFVPAHVIASMLKAAHLALFDLMGYQAIYDPCGDSLRRSLNQYFQHQAKAGEAPAYFNSFRNSVKFLMRGGVPNGREAIKVETYYTLNHGVFWLYFNLAGLIFAATCLFQINDVIVTVTIPQCSVTNKVDVAIKSYEQLLAENTPVPHTVHAARIENGVCEVNRLKIPITFGVPPEWEPLLKAAIRGQPQ